MMHHFLLAFWVLFESWFTSVSVWHLPEFKINLWHQSEEPANNVFCNRRTQIFYLTSCPCVFVMQTWRYQTVWSYLPVSKGATRRASANSFVNLKTFWALVSPPWSPTGFHFQTGEHQQHLCRITRFGFAQWGVSLRGFCFCRLAIRKGGGTLSGVFLHIVTFWLRDNEAVPPQSPPNQNTSIYQLPPRPEEVC